MTVKDYLGQLKNIDRRIKDKISESEKWRDIAQNPSCGIKEIQVQTSIKPDKMGDAVALAVTYEKESEELAQKLVELKHTIIEQIDNIGDDMYYKILKEYYIKERNLSVISVTEGIAYRQVRRLYSMALECFDGKYGATYKDDKPFFQKKV